MTTLEWIGIFSVGFVFGYLLYYAVRHTEKFNIDLLSGAIGAVGGGVLIAKFDAMPGWIGPYGLGLGVVFIVYLALALFLANDKALSTAAGTAAKFLAQTLLGVVPRA